MPRERKKKAVDDPDNPKPAKKRRGSAANSRNNATPQPGTPNGLDQNGHNQMYGPPQHMGYGMGGGGGVGAGGETMHASNPFDDAPSMMGGQMGGPGHPGMGQGPPPMHPGMHPGMPPNGPPMGPPSHMQHGGPPPPGGPPGMNMMGGPPPMMSPHNGMMHGGSPGMGMHPPPPGMRGGPPVNGPPRGMPGGPPPMGMPPGGPGGMPGGPPPNSMMSGRTYPPEQAMIFNPNNPNAPPIYPCGHCHKEVNESDQGIPCESGCNFWFHRACTGLTEKAFLLLRGEAFAEWVCDGCVQNKVIPLIKFKP